MDPDTMVAQVAAKVHWNIGHRPRSWQTPHSSYLEEEESVLGGVQIDQDEVWVSDEATPGAKCKCVAANKKCQSACNKLFGRIKTLAVLADDDTVRTKAEISKVFDENVGHIFTSHRPGLNESKPGLPERMFSPWWGPIYWPASRWWWIRWWSGRSCPDWSWHTVCPDTQLFLKASDSLNFLITGRESVKFDRIIFGSSDIL